MAVLNELKISNAPASGPVVEMIKELLGLEFWRWYDANHDHKIVTVRVWFISKAVRVRDLYSVFEMLFGPHPSA